MSRQYDNWILSQQEPEMIVKGNAKRFGEIKPAFKEQWDAMDKLRAELGEEKFREMMAEDAKDRNRLREYLND